MTDDLLNSGPPRVINIGLAQFARDLQAQGLPCVHVDWRPPAGGDAALEASLRHVNAVHGERIAAANTQAVARMQQAEPVLVDVGLAKDLIEGLDERRILHAGPPITWERMCGPLRGAIAGAAVFEGWAANLAEGFELAAEGAFTFSPNHHHGAVGPMTGLTTGNMAVMVVENRAFSNRAYCTLNEGVGKVLRFGANDATVIARLHWLAGVLRPLLSTALADSGGVNLKSLAARGLAMGDEMHQRNAACTSLFIRELAPFVSRCAPDAQTAGAVLSFMGSNDQWFLNMAMAMGKAIMDPLAGIAHCSLVTAMARNGTDFGVRVSATADTWFTAPVEMPRGLYFPGFSAADANPDLGDSTIVETIGLGGFAMAAAPAVAGFVGAGSASEALAYTRAMYAITCARGNDWTIPALDFAGVPTGIDVLKVAHSGVMPTINTGIAHRQPGIGQVGAGIVEAPYRCFTQAADAFIRTLDTP